MTAPLPTTQLNAKEMAVYSALLLRAPQPVTWQALAMVIWPAEKDRESRTNGYVRRYINAVRSRLGNDSIETIEGGSYALGAPIATPVPTFFTPRWSLKGVATHTLPATAEVVKIDTAAFIAAQVWAQSQRPSAGVANVNPAR